MIAPGLYVATMSTRAFSRSIAVARIGAEPEVHDIAATAEECAAIAREFNIPGIGALAGHYVLRAEGDGEIAAALHLTAMVTRTCVVTLDDFEAEVDERAELLFIPAERMSEMLEGPDEPDEIPYEGTAIDLGAALTEQLALALDPYPRKPGVALTEEARSDRENPFAAFFGRNGQGKA